MKPAEIPETHVQLLKSIIEDLEAETGQAWGLDLIYSGGCVVLSDLADKSFYKVTMEPKYAALDGEYDSIKAIQQQIYKLHFHGNHKEHNSCDIVFDETRWTCPQCGRKNQITSTLCSLDCPQKVESHWVPFRINPRTGIELKIPWSYEWRKVGTLEIRNTL